MSIARATNGLAIIAGQVENVRNLMRSPEKGGTQFAHEILLVQRNGARVGITAFFDQDTGAPRISVPPVGAYFAAECSIRKRGDRSDVVYERDGLAALDEIHTAAAAA